MTAVLDTRIPAGLNQDGMTPDEARQFKTLRAHRALGLIIQRVPLNIPIWDWCIRDGALEIVVAAAPTDHERRGRLMRLAEQFSLDYAENKHSPDKNMATASGIYADVPVKFWSLVKPCGCGCGGAL